jgi:[ribosomal protein S5]-alanine N-acetyltransferase
VGITLFTTNRLTIRNLKISDLEAFHQYRSNPGITKYQGFDTLTRIQAKDFIIEQENKICCSTGQWVQYGIEERDSQQLIGDCAIHLEMDNPGFAELGITISDRHQRNGFAREAMQGLIRYLFDEKKIECIVETVDAENEASIRLLKSLGFRELVHSKKDVFFKGKWGSEYKFEMLKGEWV